MYSTNKLAPTQPLNVYTAQGWAQAAFFVQELIDAGPKLTRANLLTALKNIRNFNAGGMTPTFPNPSAKGSMPAQFCNYVVESTATGYQQVLPKSGNFTCVLQKTFSYSTGS